MHPSLILALPQRSIYFLDIGIPTQVASFLIHDNKLGAILVNTPDFSVDLLTQIEQFSVKYIFLPSHLGARDLALWQEATSAEIIAHEAECEFISQKVDHAISERSKLSRTIDFLPLPGRTPGSCALYLKNLPGVIFLGPVMQSSPNNWPTIIQKEDDYSFESRLFSALSLKDTKFQYAFTDNFQPDHLYGPNADQGIRRNIERLFD